MFKKNYNYFVYFHVEKSFRIVYIRMAKISTTDKLIDIGYK